MSSNGFAPPTITVVLGVNSTVTWINDDNVHQTVTSTSFSQPFNSGDLSPYQSFSFTFTKAGAYFYECTIHKTLPAMHAEVIVK